MMDQCPPTIDEEDVYQMLMHNFRRHYDTNRAPLGLYFHTIWFKTKHNMKGMKVRGRECGMGRERREWERERWDAGG